MTYSLLNFGQFKLSQCQSTRLCSRDAGCHTTQTKSKAFTVSGISMNYLWILHWLKTVSQSYSMQLIYCGLLRSSSQSKITLGARQGRPWIYHMGTIPTNIHTNEHLSQYHNLKASWPNLHVCRLWKETRSMWRKPMHARGEHATSTQQDALGWPRDRTQDLLAVRRLEE